MVLKLLNLYLKALERKPMITQSLSAGVLMVVGDGISQFFVEKQPLRQYDTSRGTRFFLFGTILGGPALRTWYVFLDRIARGTPSIKMLKMMTADQVLFAPSFLVVFLSVMDYWKNRSVEKVQHKLRKDYFPVLMMNYKIWPAAQAINFYLIPLQFRVLFVQFVAIFWNVYLAFKSEGVQKPSEI